MFILKVNIFLLCAMHSKQKRLRLMEKEVGASHLRWLNIWGSVACAPSLCKIRQGLFVVPRLKMLARRSWCRWGSRYSEDFLTLLANRLMKKVNSEASPPTS